MKDNPQKSFRDVGLLVREAVAHPEKPFNLARGERRLVATMKGATASSPGWFSRGNAVNAMAPSGPRLAWRPALLAAASMFAISAAFLLGLRWFKGTHPEQPSRSVTVVLASGSVEVDARRVGAGTALQAEQTLRVGEGRSCVRLEPGIVSCLSGSGSLRMTSIASHARALSLLSGTVLAKLDRQAAGSTFQIDTVRGSAIAKGTIFAVEIGAGERVSVRVQEGTVVFRRSDGGEVPLVAPIRAIFDGEVELSPLTDSAEDQGLLALARLFSPAAKSQLEISSLPIGATVSLDGAELGPTPLSALVAVGQRLSLMHPGYSPVSERVWLGSEERVSRSYDLVPLADQAPTESAAPEPEPDGPVPASGSAARGPSAGANGEASGPSAEELLARARSLRASGRSLEAARAYRRMIETWPRSPEARVGLISLGELELSELSEPAAALREFSAYLKVKGTLAPEARYGRIRALGRLGRHAEESAEARDFVRDYPRSVQASDLRTRLGL